MEYFDEIELSLISSFYPYHFRLRLREKKRRRSKLINAQFWISCKNVCLHYMLCFIAVHNFWALLCLSTSICNKYIKRFAKKRKKKELQIIKSCKSHSDCFSSSFHFKLKYRLQMNRNFLFCR